MESPLETTSKPDVLVHLCGADEWERARRSGTHEPDSLKSVGFVHLSSPAQVHLPADRLYADRTDLLLLRIDAARLTSPLRWEPGLPSDPDGMRFPHLYGPLPVAAVTSVTTYRPGPDGRYPVLTE
ncbi:MULTISPECIES: DUF952 domain-containing protein [Mycolicibacterium]|uniref:Uncharacterized conserved protein n=2 Tax=Mycolicibacterium gilvum TaxID=1804 RepID=E6TER6_MYCSR|nr:MULTISPECIES: DUF952 domain-containing protein [Mycolicibacterium]ADT99899.1 uncharacterized conserved protein [Mycolicibacterium gilvum Spyr1]MBV5244536.1 DUF952 domain-containing protein [Mycolicibacterium sp. PAM1]MCV7058286.1 DUF952 domain-containing protein [Mycolicibacterium gilvum]STZ43140.1 glutathione S-transferase domain-containing protein [Mycolicibacterium gilvum]